MTIERGLGPRRLRHIPALDGLRAITVILVMLDHTIVVAPEWAGSLPHGSLGVDVFFVLSGFLITALLLRDDGEGHVRFWPYHGAVPCGNPRL